MEKIDRTLILAGGFGTRSLPYSKIGAKEGVSIDGEPAIMRLVEESLNAGIKKVCIVVSKEKLEPFKRFFSHDKKLEDMLARNNKSKFLEKLNNIIDNVDIQFVIQNKKKMNGNAGAIAAAEKFIANKPFVLRYGDNFFMTENGQPNVVAQVCETYNQTGKGVIGAIEVPESETSKYGLLVLGQKNADGSFDMKGSIEKPKSVPQEMKNGPLLVDMGCMVFPEGCNTKLLSMLPKHGAEGEVYAADQIDKWAKEGKMVCRKLDARHYDLGNHYGVDMASLACLVERLRENKDEMAKLNEDLNKMGLCVAGMEKATSQSKNSTKTTAKSNTKKAAGVVKKASATKVAGSSAKNSQKKTNEVNSSFEMSR